MKSLNWIFLPILFVGCMSCNNSKRSENRNPSSIESGTSQKTVESLSLIVAGKQIGSIKLGDDASKIMDSLGHPHAGDAAMGKALDTWILKENGHDATLSIFTSRNMGVEDISKVTQIHTTATLFKDVNGLGVGSSLDAFQSLYQLKKFGTYVDNRITYTIYETDKGIAYEFDDNNTCHGVAVHRVDGTVIGYLPFYQDFKPVEKQNN